MIGILILFLWIAGVTLLVTKAFSHVGSNKGDFYMTIGIMYLFLVPIISLYLLPEAKPFKPEYQIELLNQKDVVIKTETSTDTISFDYIEEYIEHDNL